MIIIFGYAAAQPVKAALALSAKCVLFTSFTVGTPLCLGDEPDPRSALQAHVGHQVRASVPPLAQTVRTAYLVHRGPLLCLKCTVRLGTGESCPRAIAISHRYNLKTTRNAYTMPTILGEPARPRRATRWTIIALPLTVLLSLCLLLVVPRSSHIVDELSILHEHDTIPDVQYSDDAGVQAAFSAPQHGAISHPLTQPGRKPDRRPLGSPELALAQIRPKRVAIVGAGASGSAAAFFLRRAARIMEERIGVPEGQLLGDVVVVDKEAYVGGRKSTVCAPGRHVLTEYIPAVQAGTTGERRCEVEIPRLTEQAVPRSTHTATRLLPLSS